MHNPRSGARRRTGGRVATVVVAACVLAGLPAAAANAAPKVLPASPKAAQACESGNNNTYRKLLDCMKAGGALQHMTALQQIADANGGNRAAGMPGYDASVDYVVQVLQAAGWQVEIDPFEFEFILPATLQVLTPAGPADFETTTFTGSGDGAVTGLVTPVDINLTGDRASTSGCEAADFAGFPAGTVALVQRGSCDFGVKAQNAQDAGAIAVIIFNQGNTPEREALLDGTLLPTGAGVTIPVVGASFAQGELLATPGTEVFVEVPPIVVKTNVNVIATLPGKNPDNVVMAGAHLDSVQEGPGINDNASGSAVLLEAAQLLGNSKPENTLRLAFWGAEESGLIGSTDWVETHPEEVARTAAYLNFDMVSSPNFIYMVYDSDQSTFEAPVDVPAGSTAIEDLFESYFTLMGIPYEDTEFSGRSDYQAFIEAGIASSGLFTGAEEVKTAEQAAIWGGTAGEWFDPCYHQACDTLLNVSVEALEVNADAIAFALLTLAYSTETVNGVPGKSVPGTTFAVPAPAGPEGTFVGTTGGLHPYRSA